MSKKDFIALADALRPTVSLFGDHVDTYGVEIDATIDALCSFMRSVNPAFKEDRWRDYLAGKCGPNGGKIK